MRPGRVTGRLWSTIKTSEHDGKRFVIVQPIDADGHDVGEPCAGPGETVYWVRGREACIPFYPEKVASDATVVGIIDSVETRKG
jgi:ethanolamine utilization protein EutN